MSGLTQRPLPVGDIEYIYIPRERHLASSVVLPPKDFENHELGYIRMLPKNVIQLNDPFVYYGIAIRTQSHLPHRFSVVYPDSVDWYIDTHPFKKSIKVFLIHSTTTGLTEIIAKLRKAYSLMFLVLTDKPGKALKNHDEISILNSKDFIEKLKSKKEVIDEMLRESFPKQQIHFQVDLPITDLHHTFNPANSFQASHTNYWTLNQVLGNDWGGDLVKHSRKDLINQSVEASKKGKNDLSRLNTLVDQLHKFDELQIMVTEDRDLKFPNERYDWLAPLLIIIPFNFPTLGDVPDPKMGKKDNQLFKKILSSEQAINYLAYRPVKDITPELILAQGEYQGLKTRYLDGLGYLHASFTNSPVIRFPLLGNSIKKELSFFRPDQFNESKWLNSAKLIDKFGSKLSSLILTDEIASKIFDLPRQIVAISDLPVEWMSYKGANLCLTHDITRIPETPHAGIMASYVINSNGKFEVTNDILSRTLVLFGVDDDDTAGEEFKKYFSAIEEHSKTLNFKTARCASVKDVIEQISIHKPDFLIFDCHGGFDADTQTSYLMINKERLTGSDIVKHRISAPLVFLSACHTNPTYGYLNKLADAFFEAGCIAITATYFPISIEAGSNLYFRVLANLANAVQMTVHKNWLEFVSHIIRTSFHKDTIYKTTENVNRSQLAPAEKAIITRRLNALSIRTSLLLSRPDRRLEAVEHFKTYLEKICPRTLIDRRTISEVCFYTNMGRGDLVRFQNWLEEFHKANDKKLKAN